MPFPTPTQKADTTYLDNDSDAIWQARAGIKKNFDNVNDIIDSFTLSSPTEQGVLGYNGSTFTTLYPAQDPNMVYLTFDNFENTGNGIMENNGFAKATIQNTNHRTGIVKETIDSAGFTVLTFPAGSYYWQQPNPFQYSKTGNVSSARFFLRTLGFDSAGGIRGGYADQDDDYTATDQPQLLGQVYTTDIAGGSTLSKVGYNGVQERTYFPDGHFDSAGEVNTVKFRNMDQWTFDTPQSMYLQYEIISGGSQQQHPDIIIRRVA